MSRDRGFLGQPAQHALGESRRCTATSKTTGQPCGAYALPGAFVCGHHGGRAPQTVTAAKRRLLAMVEPVLAAFEEIVGVWQSVRCPTCGNPTGDPTPILHLGRLVLDRAGLHPTLSLRAETAPEAPWTEYLTDDEMAIVGELIGKAKERMERGEEPPVLLCHQNNDVVEAVLPDRETPTGSVLPETGRDEDEG
jgi:hypothetical protein